LIKGIAVAVSLWAIAAVAHAETVVETFSAACLPGLGSFEASETAITGVGWSPVAPEADPRLASIIRQSLPPPSVTVHSTLTFLREGNPGSFVILTDSTVSDTRLMTCHLYAMDAPSATPRSQLDAWVGAPPTRQESDRVLYFWIDAPNMPNALGIQYSFSEHDAGWLVTGEHLRASSVIRGGADKVEGNTQ
jgi:hypothetical protein